MTRILHESTVRDNEFNSVSVHVFTQLFSQRFETWPIMQQSNISDFFFKNDVQVSKA